MGLPSHLWSYFDKLDRYYGNNRSHHAAKCKACVEWQKWKLEIEDSENLVLGTIQHRHSMMSLRWKVCISYEFSLEYTD